VLDVGVVGAVRATLMVLALGSAAASIDSMRESGIGATATRG
jgi:hypothetical protein